MEARARALYDALGTMLEALVRAGSDPSGELALSQLRAGMPSEVEKGLELCAEIGCKQSRFDFFLRKNVLW